MSLKKKLYADIYRNCGQCNMKTVLKELLLIYESNIKFIILFRLCSFFKTKGKSFIVLYRIFNAVYKRKQMKFGIYIAPGTKIGKGLRLPHKGGIVIHPNAVIGENCEIMQNVTIGNNYIKSRNSVATIGNNVTLCAGAKIIGDVKIGNNVIIGANAVVTKDIINNTIAAGIPSKIISDNYNVPINCDYYN